MHYVFKSRADADLIMMQPVGDQMLKIIGKEPARQGIVEATAIPAAIASIEAAVAAERASDARDGGDRNDDAGAERVGLARRAWPLLEMMKRSHAEGADIVWGV